MFDPSQVSELRVVCLHSAVVRASLMRNAPVPRPTLSPGQRGVTWTRCSEPVIRLRSIERWKYKALYTNQNTGRCVLTERCHCLHHSAFMTLPSRSQLPWVSMPGPNNVYPRSHESHEYLSRGSVKCLVWPQSSDDTNTPVGHNISSICDVRIIGK